MRVKGVDASTTVSFKFCKKASTDVDDGNAPLLPTTLLLLLPLILLLLLLLLLLVLELLLLLPELVPGMSVRFSTVWSNNLVITLPVPLRLPSLPVPSRLPPPAATAATGTACNDATALRGEPNNKLMRTLSSKTSKF